MRGLQRLSARVNRLTEYSLFGMGLFLSLLIALQVLCRYAFNYSLFWSEELARFLLVWLTFLGAGAAYARGAHASVDFLHRRLPGSVRHWVTIFIHLAALAFFLIMIIYGWRFAQFVSLQVSPALNLPKWIPLSIIPISGAVMALHALAFIAREVKRPGQ